MQGSVGHIIWTVCYLSVLIGLSAYGVHRYFIIYLYLKNRKRPPVPAGYFEYLPKVTVQLPIFNEVYVAKRLLLSVSELDYPRELLQIQVLDDSMFSSFIGLIELGSRPARLRQGSPLPKANSFASSTPISFHKRIC